MLNPSPWRHYRRRYARGEVVAGAAVLCMIAAVGLWVRWMEPIRSCAARVPLEALAGDPAKSVSRVSARAAPAGGGHGSTATETASPRREVRCPAIWRRPVSPRAGRR
ncbi:MAG: hypothetical protein IPK07_03120 [Deltaproteobacteria bacterium]|nr:hypothetical protein [Deltaproteobacteria bacterium]